MSLDVAVEARLRATVVVVTFNHRHVVPRCLDAVRATVGSEAEVVVVDNASTDGTADRVQAEYPWVRLVRSATNVGFGAAANLGAARARGPYLVFLNPDTEPQPRWLAALLAGLEAAPRAGLATAKLLLAGAPERLDAFGNEVHVSGITTCRGWSRPAGSFDRPDDVSAVSGACFAVPRALFARLGGFDERLFLYFEDTDLSLRARLAGHRCLAVPDALVLHDHRPGVSATKLRCLERNRWWTLLKVYRWPTLIALGPVLLAAEGVAWGMAARNGRSHLAAKALAWGDLARWLPALPAARASAQLTRRVPDGKLLRRHTTRLRVSQVAGGALAQAAEWLAALLFALARAPAAALCRP
jgi:GT2 family glycosyltransferase